MISSIKKNFNQNNQFLITTSKIEKKSSTKNSNWSPTKTKIAAGAAFSIAATGLGSLTYFNLGNNNITIDPPFSGAITKVFAGLFTIACLAMTKKIPSTTKEPHIQGEIPQQLPSYISRSLNETLKDHIISSIEMSDLQTIDESTYNKIDDIINFLTTSHQEIPIDKQKHLIYTLRNLLLTEYVNSTIHGKSLEKLFDLCLKINHQQAYDIATHCVSIDKNKNELLKPYIENIINKTKEYPNFESEIKNEVLFKCLFSSDSTSSSATNKPNSNTVSPEKSYKIVFEGIEKQLTQKRPITDTNFDEIEKIINDLASLEINGKISSDHQDQVNSLIFILIKLINSRGATKNYLRISQILSSTYFALEKLDSNLAVKIASTCVNKKCDENDSTNTLFNMCQSIVKSTKTNDPLMIPFAIFCAEKSTYLEEHKKIAQEIWEQIQNNPVKKIEFLIGCSKNDNDFCQEKLEKFALADGMQTIPEFIDLQNSCMENLFYKHVTLPRPGNKAIILKTFEAPEFKNPREVIKDYKEFKIDLAESLNNKKITHDTYTEQCRRAFQEYLEFPFKYFICSENVANIQLIIQECEKYPEEDELKFLVDIGNKFLAHLGKEQSTDVCNEDENSQNVNNSLESKKLKSLQ